MKSRYILTSLIVLILAVSINGQAWKKVTTQTMAAYSDSYFISANNGWLVGSAGSIRKTTDGGSTWTTITTTITEDLKSVYFIDQSQGFAASATKIYKTTDGFATYTTITVTGVLSSPAYYGIYFADTQRGWFLSSTSSAGKVLQTTDGGTTWTQGFSCTTCGIQTFSIINDGSVGIAIGGGSGKFAVYYLKNGTWTAGTAPTWPTGITYTRLDIRSIFFTSASTAVAAGWGSSAAGLQPTIFIKTSDGGATWTYQLQSDANKTYEYVYAMCFKDASTGLAAGGATKSSNILKTTDGGTTWVPLTTPCAFQVNRLFCNGDNVIAVTTSNAIFKSTDFGTSWESLIPIPSTTMTKLFAVNDKVIYAGGAKGVILKTTDSGNTWKTLYMVANNACVNINGLYFTSENVGYSANGYSMITKTTDGGVTWTALKKDSTSATSTNYAVAFTSANVGFVVGQSATNVSVIYKTTDGGSTFSTTNATVAAALYAVAFYNSQVGIAVGNKMQAVYTSDGGTTWNVSTINGVPSAQASAALNGVIFYSATEAIAVGDKVTIRTTDGGATWNYINVTFDQTLNAVAYSNNNTWALGTKSAKPKSIGILQSTDKAASWTNKVDYAVFDTTSLTYNDIAVSPSGHVFICGGSSAVYTNSSLVDVEENKNELPTVFELKQNYPNPFNPTTNISYTLNQTGVVKLQVYDVLGRLVKTLVNENQNVGKHVVEFNAAGLASGTYIYRMFINNSVSSKKMVLIK